MIVQRKIDYSNKEYLEFNGCSHLYFINGYVNNDSINLYVGSKVLQSNFDILYEIIRLCLKNFRVVKVITNRMTYVFNE